MQSTEGGGAWRSLLSTRGFLRLSAAGIMSSLGDQFDLIAFPWLLLVITGDPLAVGAIIAVSSVPTVVFMLIGGTLIDRFDPRRIMQVSNLARVALSLVLAALIYTDLTPVWLIYVFAVLKGMADAFYYPAQSAIVPRIVATGHLRRANSLLQTTAETSGIVGPMLAGVLIAFDRVAPSAPSSTGSIALAFAAVALMFLAVFVLVAGIRLPTVNDEAPSAEMDAERKAGGMFGSIIHGVRFVRANTTMFSLFVLIAGIELLVQGPTIVGMPVLAHTRLPEGSVALGIISSSYAVGALLGAVLAGVLPAPRRRLGTVLIAMLSLCGALLMPFGFMTATTPAAALLFCIGVMGGYFNIQFTSWLQTHTPPPMMGRVMSLLMVASIGLSPISNAVSGALIRISLGWVFLVAGASMALLCVLFGLQKSIRDMRATPDDGEPVDP